jgi:hypothetical protein
LDLLPSLLTPEDHVLPPIKTYTKMSLISLTATPTPVIAQSLSTSSRIPAFHLSLANTFAAEEISFTPSSVNVNASDGELMEQQLSKVLPQSLEQGILY